MPKGHLELLLKSREHLVVWNKKEVNEDEIIRIYLSGKDIRKVAEIIGESRDIVKRVLNENHIQTRTSVEQKKLNKDENRI